MNELFFQVVLALAGAVTGAIIPLLTKAYQKVTAVFLAGLLIVAALIWFGYEWGYSSGKVANSSLNMSSKEPMTYLDFESPDEKDRWRSTDISIITRSSDQVFNGDYSLAIATNGTPSGEYILAEWEQPPKADMILGRVYWPERADVEVIWAQFCISGVGACTDFAVTPGRWNAFAVNLYKDGLSDERHNLYLQGNIAVESPGQTYTFYIDSIEMYVSE